MKRACLEESNNTYEQTHANVLPEEFLQNIRPIKINFTRMKNIIIIIALILSTGYIANAQTEAQKVDICSGMAGADATYQKDYVIDLPAAQGDEKAPVAKYSMILQKDTKYRFTICTDDDSPGKGILQLLDLSTIIASTFNPTTGKEFKGFDFDCQKTGVYHLFVTFHDGKAGKAIVILSFVKKL